MTKVAVPGFPGETFRVIRGVVDLVGDNGSLLLNWSAERTQDLSDEQDQAMSVQIPRTT